MQQAVAPKIISGIAIEETWWKRALRWLITALTSAVFVTIMAWLQETDGFIPTYSLLFSAITCKIACSFSFFFLSDIVATRLGLLKMKPYDKEDVGDADGEYLANEAENDEDK